MEYHSKPAVTPLVISLPGPVPYKSDKVVPYKYNATILEDGVEVPIQPMPDVGNITDNSRVTRSGRVFAPVIRRDVVAGKKIAENDEPKKITGETSGATLEKEVDDILKIIKMSDYKIVDQLLQTPSKISILALLMNSSAHRESLMRVLDQAFMENDMPLDPFSSVIGNITSCNNFSFCDDELPDEGRNHNLALHISMNCKNDSLSNVLIDNGSALNVILRSTLMKLKY